MSDKPNMNSAPSDAPRLRAGIFELSGISGVSLALADADMDLAGLLLPFFGAESAKAVQKQ